MRWLGPWPPPPPPAPLGSPPSLPGSTSTAMLRQWKGVEGADAAQRASGTRSQRRSTEWLLLPAPCQLVSLCHCDTATATTHSSQVVFAKRVLGWAAAALLPVRA